MVSDSDSTPAPFNPGPVDVPDLTTALVQSSKRLAGKGSFAAVYRCSCAQNGEVAVKAISSDRSVDQAHRDEFLRQMRRELGLWKRLDHPNIVPLLGTALGADFGSNYPCTVSMWMPHGTLVDYVSKCDNVLSLPDRMRLITGSAAGLEYLHSKSVVHGDLHPCNILIDNDHNPRLTDFGSSQDLSSQDDLSYLSTTFTYRGARMWAAPELLHPHLFPVLDDSNNEPALNVDIYSLGSIILLILCGKSPWNSAEFENKLDEFQNPPRPLWPIIPDAVWDFIERCWSPQAPEKRPLAQEVLWFARNKLQQLLQPNPDTDINVVLFGTRGCGKSSIINLLAEEPIAPVSTNMEPCTEQSRCYQISIGERKFRLWDTTEFHLARGDINHLSPYEQAHTVLRNLPDGVHLILLCAHKDEIPSLGSLFWLINNFFFGGRAPVAFVVTHFDDFNHRLWNRNQRSIAKMTGIPIQSILHTFRTTALTGDDDDQKLKALLANAVSSIPLPFNFSSHEAAARDIATHCGLSDSDATALVERFSRPQYVQREDHGEPSPPVSETNSEDGDADRLEERQPDEQPTLGGHDDTPSTPENPGKISPSQPATVAHSEEGSGDRLEAEVSPSTPDSEFNYNDSLSSSHSSAAPRSLSCDEPLSPATSGQPQEDEILPGPSHAPPMTSIPEACALENLDAARSSHRHSIFKRLLQRKSNKDPTSHKPNRLSGESCELADCRSPLRARVSDRHKEPSRMAAARSKITKRPRARSPTETAIPANPNASRNVQGAADRKGAGHAQQVNDDSQTSSGAIHVTDQRGSGYSVISIRLPSWMLCRASVAEDETHVTGQDRDAVGMQGQSGT